MVYIEQRYLLLRSTFYPRWVSSQAHTLLICFPASRDLNVRWTRLRHHDNFVDFVFVQFGCIQIDSWFQ
jgi:hypothetical protein